MSCLNSSFFYVYWRETQCSKVAFVWSAEPFLQNNLGRKLHPRRNLIVKNFVGSERVKEEEEFLSWVLVSCQPHRVTSGRNKKKV